MNWRVWDQIEDVLCTQQIEPILAIVPDNRDPVLQVSSADEHFWDRARGWQARGWKIGLHGWQHRFVTNDAGIIGTNPNSEFAGLPEAEQERKLRLGLDIFRSEDIKSDLWVAPAHSFDSVTVKLLSELGFRYISDGLSPLPYVDHSGITWIPQQLWGFRTRPFGVWTICFHINSWADRDVAEFRENVERYHNAISNVSTVAAEFRERRETFLDSFTADLFRRYIVWRRIQAERKAASYKKLATKHR